MPIMAQLTKCQHKKEKALALPYPKLLYQPAPFPARLERGGSVTKKELEEYRHLGNEIKLYQDEKKDIRRELNDYEQASSTVKGSMTQFPFTQRCIFVGGVPGYEDEQEAELMALARKIERLRQRRQSIREFIESIDDSELRQIFTLRFLEGSRKLEWSEVAKKMGPGYTAEAVKKRVQRYFRKI